MTFGQEYILVQFSPHIKKKCLSFEVRPYKGYKQQATWPWKLLTILSESTDKSTEKEERNVTVSVQFYILAV